MNFKRDIEHIYTKTRAALINDIGVPLRRVVDRLLDALPESPSGRLAVVALTASTLTLVVVGSIGHEVLRDADADRAERLGKALAEELAVLAIEPLIAGDRIHLGVLANRIAELDAISNVTVITIDDRVLAEVGTRASIGVQYTAPILLEGDLAGHVRVTVAPGAFGTRGRDLAFLLLAGLAATLLSGAGAYLLGRRIERRRQQVLDAEAAAAANDAAHAQPNERFYLVINLYNQLSLPSADRHTVIAACGTRLTAVARSFRGRCDTLPGIGQLLQFDGFIAGGDGRRGSDPALERACARPDRRPERSESERESAAGLCAKDGCSVEPLSALSRGADGSPVQGVEVADDESMAKEQPPERAFEAICAALLAVDVVGELVAAPPVAGAPALDFRFALHVLRLPAEDHLQSEAINDTVLLSAVAPGREIAASQDLFARITHKQRFGTRTQENPALHALTTARKGSCVLIASVDDELRVELDRQVDKLIGFAPSTSRPSAF